MDRTEIKEYLEYEIWSFLKETLPENVSSGSLSIRFTQFIVSVFYTMLLNQISILSGPLFTF